MIKCTLYLKFLPCLNDLTLFNSLILIKPEGECMPTLLKKKFIIMFLLIAFNTQAYEIEDLGNGLHRFIDDRHRSVFLITPPFLYTIAFVLLRLTLKPHFLQNWSSLFNIYCTLPT